MNLLAQLSVDHRELTEELAVVALGGSLELGDGLGVVEMLLCVRPSTVVVVARIGQHL